LRLTRILGAVKGFRTLIFNVTAAGPPLFDVVAQAVQEVEAQAQYQALIPPEFLPHYALLVAVVNFWLRTKTTTPAGRPKVVGAISGTVEVEPNNQDEVAK